MSDAGDAGVHDGDAVLVEEWHVRLQAGSQTRDHTAAEMRALVEQALLVMAADLTRQLASLHPGDRADVVLAT